MKWYGSLINRLEENKMHSNEIEVGTLATIYLWSDRNAYEVVEVINANHIKIRRLKAIRTDKNYQSDSQSYRYEQDDNGETRELKRGRKGWNWVLYHTDEDGKRKVFRREKINISFGIADEYYDYTF